MKRTTFLAIVVLAFAIAAHAQDTMKKDAAVKAADPESKVVFPFRGRTEFPPSADQISRQRMRPPSVRRPATRRFVSDQQLVLAVCRAFGVLAVVE